MYPILSWLDDRVDAVVRLHIASQPRAAGFAYSSYADAEAGGENLVFERALRRATDPQIAKMIRVHQQDEMRHAQMIEDRRIALGLPGYVVPDEMKLVERLSEAAGGVLDLPMDRDEHVASVYALLYVVEERAIQLFERQVRTVEALGDHESADMFRAIWADEERHLKYCRAVGKRYAGSEAAFEAEVEQIRRVEAGVYARASRGTLRHLLRTGMLELPWWGVLLRAALELADAAKLPAPRLTGPILVPATHP